LKQSILFLLSALVSLVGWICQSMSQVMKSEPQRLITWNWVAQRLLIHT
jgi:hypothetical protein